MQGALIQSLVGELRFHMPYGIAEKKKKKRGRWAKRKGTLERVEITLASLILSWAILLEALQGFPV